jgi:hypothetical protein
VLQAGGATLVVTSRPVSLHDRGLFWAHGQEPRGRCLSALVELVPWRSGRRRRRRFRYDGGGCIEEQLLDVDDEDRARGAADRAPHLAQVDTLRVRSWKDGDKSLWGRVVDSLLNRRKAGRVAQAGAGDVDEDDVHESGVRHAGSPA